MQKSEVFETTYKNYLKKLSEIDIISRAGILGVEVHDNSLVILFYEKPFKISKKGVFDPSGSNANFAVSVLLCQYILRCPDKEPEQGNWQTFREFKDSGPLASYFTSNINKIIETSFAEKLPILKIACDSLGGKPFEDGTSYDLSMKFNILPKIPIVLHFNDKDEEFPAQSSLLFRQSAQEYLDMECLSIGGTYLVGNLLEMQSK